MPWSLNSSQLYFPSAMSIHTHTEFPPTRTIGRVFVLFARALMRFSEKVFGLSGVPDRLAWGFP